MHRASKIVSIKAAGLILVLVMMVSCREELHKPGNLVPKTVVEDPTLPALLVNGARLHTQAFGPVDGTLIICLHGGPGDNYRYMLNCKSLAEKGYRVVFYDQTGSGLSERFPKNWYEEKEEEALDLVFYDELKVLIALYKTRPSQKVILLGHSWGAMLATGYTGQHPNDVDGLIVAEPGGLAWADVQQYFKQSRSLSFWSEAFNDATFLDQFIMGGQNQHEILDYKIALLSASSVNVGDIIPNLGTNAQHYRSSRNGAVVSAAMFEFGERFKPNLSAGISNFQRKVLFLYSSNNKAYSDSWAQKISAAYPNNELFKVQGVGHSGMLDQIDVWTAVTEPRIVQYLESL